MVESMSRHMASHMGLKPHNCTICHAKFARAYHLNRHMKTVHKNSVQENALIN